MNSNTLPRHLAVSLLFFFLLFLIGACQKTPPPEQALQTATHTGSEACRECHEEIFNGWKATFHAYKFQQANPRFIIGDFKSGRPVELQDHKYTMKEADGRFIVSMSRKGQDETSYPVKYVIGSIWKQVYITEFPGGALQVLPLQWLVKTRSWSAIPGITPANWKDRNRAFQYQCMGCHTTRPGTGENAAGDGFNTAWLEPGVGCEACHGPGTAHIKAPPQDKAATILNPSKLADPARAAEICGACHTRGVSSDKKHAFPVGYQPGGQLHFLFDTNPGVYPDGSPKEHHQQYDDWKQSGHARSGVMCWDCHSPHATGKSNRFQLKLPGSLLCTTCHKIRPAGVHGLHTTDNCMGCHMPNTIRSATPGDLRSHRFLVARPELTVEAGDAQKQPNSCNLCHYHKDTDPERLVHYLRGVKKPVVCKSCHYHAEQDPDDEEE